MWAAGAEEEPATPKRKQLSGSSCRASTTTRGNDDDDAAGTQSIASTASAATASLVNTTAKRMARISSVLHTIPESLPASTTSAWHSISKPPRNNGSSTSKSGTALVVVNAADVRQGRMLTFHSQLVEWHYNMQESVRGLPYDVALLSLLSLFAIASVGSCTPAVILNTMLVGTVLGLAVWPLVMIPVREELFYLLALRQLMHIDSLQVVWCDSVHTCISGWLYMFLLYTGEWPIVTGCVCGVCSAHCAVMPRAAACAPVQAGMGAGAVHAGVCRGPLRDGWATVVAAGTAAWQAARLLHAHLPF